MPERLLDLLGTLFWEAMTHEPSWYPATFTGRCSWCGTHGAERGVLAWIEHYGEVAEARWFSDSRCADEWIATNAALAKLTEAAA
jgi:hypothetical protein